MEITHPVSYTHLDVYKRQDIGTVVLKNATFKFFLTATPEERADRRYKELISKGINSNYDEILQDIKRRDYIDSHRDIDPLKKADDAIEIDTTGLGISEVVDKMACIIEETLKEIN